MELEGFVTAAFWIGMEHSDDEVRSVTVRADSASFSSEGPELREFLALLIQRGIDFSVDFLPERGKKPVPRDPGGSAPKAPNRRRGWEQGYLEELAALKKALDEGHLTMSQYE